MNRTVQQIGNDLQALLDKADLDGALAKVQSMPSVPSVDSASIYACRYANLRSEVLDYGGQYKASAEAIQPFADRATAALGSFTTKNIEQLTPADAELYHQYCYVLMNVGMGAYRHANYRRVEFEQARDKFELAERALLRLADWKYPHLGALSRARYCIGLVYRELYDYAGARRYFAQSIENGASALNELPPDSTKAARYKYAMSRSYGLGNAWISYTEASLSEAKCHIVASRLLLVEAHARYIDAYINLVNAIILMSSESTLAVTTDALKILARAYEDLGGDAAVAGPGAGHGPYAIRVAIELASAYLKLAQISVGKEHDDHCFRALDFVEKVRRSPHVEYDNRSLCKSYIIESRIHREKREYPDALVSADAALETGRNQEFSRVDCWLTLGEARFYNGDYSGAADAFGTALQFGSSNRKIFAACHLHLSRTYFKDNQPSKARYHFDIWDSTGRRAFENAFIRELSAEVEASLKWIELDFIISAKEPDLTADKHIDRLRGWLARLALSKTADDNSKEAAFMLGVSDSTLANWLRIGSDANLRKRGARRLKGA